MMHRDTTAYYSIIMMLILIHFLAASGTPPSPNWLNGYGHIPDKTKIILTENTNLKLRMVCIRPLIRVNFLQILYSWLSSDNKSSDSKTIKPLNFTITSQETSYIISIL